MFDTDPYKIIPEGRYEILETLGYGSLGTVYRARDLVTGTPVVLKLLHLMDREVLARTDREIALLKNLPKDTHVISFSEGFLSPDARSAALFYEWIDGPSLQSLVEDYGQGLPIAVTAAITHQLCSGLLHLHQNNIVHRDIKPSNILISNSGVVKLADFGLAVLANKEVIGSDITAIGSFVGTIRYAAPEMVSGQEFSTSSDIYALGITMMFMILGNPPLPDASVPYLLQKILEGKFLDELSDSEKATWGALLSSVIDIRPANRPSPNELLSMLNKTFPSDGQGNVDIVVSFIRDNNLFQPSSPCPPHIVRSTPEFGEPDSLGNLVRSLASQIVLIQSIVADMTVTFTKWDYPLLQSSSTSPNSIGPEKRIETTFKAIRKRLGLTWKFSMGMTLILFAIFIMMVVLAILFGLIYQKSFWGILFGGTSGLSLLTVVVWKPMDKMLFTTIAMQQLEFIQLNYQRALSGTRKERREVFRDVVAQLDSLLTKVTTTSRT